MRRFLTGKVESVVEGHDSVVPKYTRHRPVSSVDSELFLRKMYGTQS